MNEVLTIRCKECKSVIIASVFPTIYPVEDLNKLLMEGHRPAIEPYSENIFDWCKCYYKTEL